LIFTDKPGTHTSVGSCQGSKEDFYEISLFQGKEWESVQVGDTEIKAIIITTCCKIIDLKSGKLNPMCNCKGNDRHTVCYHSLGYLKHKLAQRGKHISYYENILGALNGLNFGGQLTKVVSKQGKGVVWSVVRDMVKIPVVEIKEVTDEKEVIDKLANKSALFEFQKDVIKRGLEKGNLSVEKGLGKGIFRASSKPITSSAINLMRGNEDDEGID
jgi:hypothetical protein